MLTSNTEVGVGIEANLCVHSVTVSPLCLGPSAVHSLMLFPLILQMGFNFLKFGKLPCRQHFYILNLSIGDSVTVKGRLMTQLYSLLPFTDIHNWFSTNIEK